MGIISITTDVPGQIGDIPRRLKIITSDNLSTVTTAGYLNPISLQGYSIFNTDIIDMWYSATASIGQNISLPGTYEVFIPSISNGVITLSLWANSGNVLLPVVANDFASFNGTSGQIKDAGYLPSDAAKTRVVMANGTVSVSTIAQFIDAAGTIGNSNIATNSILVTNVATPNTSSNVVRFDVTVGQAALASAGSVTLQASSGSKQFVIVSLQLNSGGTNFSGGGGDRLGQVTDGTTVYSVVPAATMQSLVNAQWGVTALPNPAAAAINTQTAAGSPLVFKYSGGTTDYTAGSLVISGTLIRVA